MCDQLSAHSSGVGFGAIFAATHDAWIEFVVSGVSESAVETVARTNFVEYEDTIDFDPSLTGAGLTIAFVAGYLMGGSFALIWNWRDRDDAG